MGYRLLVTIAAVLFVQAAIAAPFNDPDGRYTIDVPEPWAVTDLSHRPIFPIMRTGDDYRKSQILVSVTNPVGSLEAELNLTVGNARVEKSQRIVAGAPCAYAKWKNFAWHLGDVLICSITTVAHGKRAEMRFSITSDGEEAIYAEQHQTFETIVQSVRWNEGTSAAPP